MVSLRIFIGNYTVCSYCIAFNGAGFVCFNAESAKAMAAESTELRSDKNMFFFSSVVSNVTVTVRWNHVQLYLLMAGKHDGVIEKQAV